LGQPVRGGFWPQSQIERRPCFGSRFGGAGEDALSLTKMDNSHYMFPLFNEMDFCIIGWLDSDYMTENPVCYKTGIKDLSFTACWFFRQISQENFKWSSGSM
jgi:hypothetical protein